MDFLIAESLLELENDHIALVRGEPVEISVQLAHAFLVVSLLVWLECRASDFLPLDVVERLDALFLAQDVECPIPTDCEEPGFKALLDFIPILLAEPDEGVLDHVAGEIGIIEDGGGIADE